MLDEYALIPDIFDPLSYSTHAFIEICLPHLKDVLLQEALVRDLCDGGWSAYCSTNSGNSHRLCKELLRKLERGNRLRRFPQQNPGSPTSSLDWCKEGLASDGASPLTGIIAAHETKRQCAASKVASIEKLTGTPWWQARSPSRTVDRKTAIYLEVLDRVLKQANSLMFIDPNLDPSSYNYREFDQLLAPLAGRLIPPRIEIHRSFCKGDGPARTFPTATEWKRSFAVFSGVLNNWGLGAEVFFWDDFHERYLVTDIFGVSVPAGFDVTRKANDCSTWGRLGRRDKDDIQRLFDPAYRQPKLEPFLIGRM